MISTERRRRDPIYLQLAYVPLQEAKALLNRTPLDVVFRRVVALERIGHDARSSRAPLREERLEAQLEFGLLLEVECVDLGVHVTCSTTFEGEVCYESKSAHT